MTQTKVSGIGEIYARMPETQEKFDLIQEIHTTGGWRAIFDRHCHEWKLMPMLKKQELLRRTMMLSRMTLDQIMYRFKHEYRGRPDIAQCVDQALVEVLESMLLEKKS
jgi:hypothetical protein